MARDRNLLVNFERMRREMDELFGDVWGEGGWCQAPRQTGFSRTSTSTTAATRRGRSSRSNWRASSSTTSAWRSAAASWRSPGERPVQETEGRVYQQVEIPAGPFRRIVELQVDVVAERARPPTRTACCGSSCRFASSRGAARADRPGLAWPGAAADGQRGRCRRGVGAPGGLAGAEVVESADPEEAIRASEPLPEALPVLPLKRRSSIRTR